MVSYLKNKLTVVGKVDLEKIRELVDIEIKKKVVLVSPILKRNKERDMIRVASQVAQKKGGDVIAPLQCKKKKNSPFGTTCAAIFFLPLL